MRSISSRRSQGRCASAVDFGALTAQETSQWLAEHDAPVPPDQRPATIAELYASLSGALQEFLGHADSKTTQIYAHYAPSEHEVKMVDDAFEPDGVGEQIGEQIESN